MKLVLHTLRLNHKNRDVVKKLIELIPQKSLYATSEIASHFNIKKSPLSGDIIIAIGGDGTTLATEDSLEKETPILPVHTGQVGFLSEIGPDDLAEKIPRLLKKRYTIEKRKKIDAILNKKKIGDALNEVTIMSSRSIKTCVLEVRIDGKIFETFEGDGVIIATPTGSTAYALSVGGPIMDPKTEALLVTPVSPYTLKARPLVFPSKSKAEIRLKEGRCYIGMDGQKLGEFTKEDSIIIRQSRTKAKLVRFGEAFYNKLDTLVR